MKNLFNSFISVVLILLLVFSGLSIYMMSMQKRNAEIFHDKVIHEIESSDFSTVVINNAIAKGNELGYNVSITPLTIVENKRMYTVSLRYDVNLPIFNFGKTATLDGYAR